MTTTTCIDIADDAPFVNSPTTRPNNNDAACLHFTPVPIASVGISCTTKTNMRASCVYSPRKKIISNPGFNPPPLEVALAADHRNDFFDSDMENIGGIFSDLATYDELCIQNIFDRDVPFVLEPRVRKRRSDTLLDHACDNSF
mmetsp:Transcript_673/g.1894  ORF Transcript_673/g.1894 Transcript_673/m.1894 type:complete len:143 (+) Transcript_673:199-627(+)|eukprot:CAMPEP_0181048776 /NCGR_PEP_ID=MMETSP1070-20121207/15618_1 /TAXON_ID=265543 /ORGANISM="Minutocellus polymorphus, Strain NH13" /LENGTH=142 /DNA_ID=CAMNT_0023127587 /DNA_START=393 /DNA_END=821 /DNA_ORIENTATION=+